MSKLVKQGKFLKRQVKPSNEDESSETSSETEHLDNALVRLILDSYLSSKIRKRCLINPDMYLSPQEIGPFLALECLIRGRGVSEMGHFMKK